MVLGFVYGCRDRTNLLMVLRRGSVFAAARLTELTKHGQEFKLFNLGSWYVILRNDGENGEMMVSSIEYRPRRNLGFVGSAKNRCSSLTKICAIQN